MVLEFTSPHAGHYRINLSIAQICPQASRAVSLNPPVPEQKESLLHQQQPQAIWQLWARCCSWAYTHNCAEKRNHREKWSIALRKVKIRPCTSSPGLCLSSFPFLKCLPLSLLSGKILLILQGPTHRSAPPTPLNRGHPLFPAVFSAQFILSNQNPD